MSETRPTLVTLCPSCRGWTRVLDGDWVVPHFPARGPRVCRGSCRRTGGEVITTAELDARLAAAPRAT